MMARPQRWAVSLADMSLLLACALFMTASSNGRPALHILADIPLDKLFLPHEARLHPAGEARLALLRQQLPAQAALSIGVAPDDAPSAPLARLDAWELAAARAAALARALRTTDQATAATAHPAASGRNDHLYVRTDGAVADRAADRATDRGGPAAIIGMRPTASGGASTPPAQMAQSLLPDRATHR